MVYLAEAFQRFSYDVKQRHVDMLDFLCYVDQSYLSVSIVLQRMIVSLASEAIASIAH